MELTKTAYRIKVTTPIGNVYLICVSYSLSSNNYGLDFYEISWPSGLESPEIPSHRQATFAEELRATHRASCTRESDNSEEQFMVLQLRKVYGDMVILNMSVINPLMTNYDLKSE